MGGPEGEGEGEGEQGVKGRKLPAPPLPRVRMKQEGMKLRGAGSLGHVSKAGTEGVCSGRELQAAGFVSL